jgi:hypothetical protein
MQKRRPDGSEIQMSRPQQWHENPVYLGAEDYQALNRPGAQACRRSDPAGSMSGGPK